MDRSLILIVEDDHGSREGLAAFLALSHFRVLTAREGQEGLALARRHCPKLILLDPNLPTMDGVACRAAQRADRAIQSVPVIVMSGRLDVAYITRRSGKLNDIVRHLRIYGPPRCRCVSKTFPMATLERRLPRRG